MENVYKQEKPSNLPTLQLSNLPDLFQKCLETAETTKSFEYRKCLETAEITKSLENSLFQGIL